MIKNKEIAIVGSVGIPANYGGFETLVEYLTLHLRDKLNITVFCSGKAYKEKLLTHNGATLEYVNFRANGIQSIPYDIVSLIRVKREIKTVLVLGVASGFFFPIYKFFTRKKLIVNIDGVEWRRDKWTGVAKFYLKQSERLAVKYADYIVADNKAISDYVKDSYKKEARTIAYGADHVVSKNHNHYKDLDIDFFKSDYACKVCRIEPENNIELILNAFKLSPDKKICIVGNWDSSDYGVRLKAEFSGVQNILLLDPIYNQEKLDLIRGGAYLYVHGHSAGGTNPSLVEAMFLCLPIVCFDVSFNIETTEGKALAYFKSEKDLIEILKCLTFDDLENNSKVMKCIAEENYRWGIIANKYLDLIDN